MSSELQRAPPRGRYDRAQSREERQTEQHERLLLAVAQAFREGELTLNAVVRRAGTGRNTFYEYFDDLQHALDQVEQRAVRLLQLAVRPAESPSSPLAIPPPPIETLRGLLRAWFETLHANEEVCAVALRAPDRPDALLSPAAEMLQRTTTELGTDDAWKSALPGCSQPTRVLALAVLIESLSRAGLSRKLALAEAEQEGFELAFRILR